MNGWVKLHRKYRDNPRSSDPDWVAVWIWMLTEAAYEPGRRIIWKGKPYELKPGQFTAGRKQIAAKTGVSESKVFRVIEHLKNEQQIEQQPSNKYSLFTVLKWQQYQSNEQQNEQQLNIQRTATEHPANTPKEREEVQEREEVWAAIPTLDEVLSEADRRSVTSDCAKRFYDWHESEQRWLNQFGKLINWKHKLTVWQNTDRQNGNHKKHNPTSIDRNQGTANANVVNDYAHL